MMASTEEQAAPSKGQEPASTAINPETTQVDADDSKILATPLEPTPTAIPVPILQLTKCSIRLYHPSDAPAVAVAANDPDIARFMRNTFPSPYTLLNAEYWISIAGPLNFAIFARDEESGEDVFAGGIGLRRLLDVESRTMEIGYWLGRAHRGRGIGSEALRAFSRWAFENVEDLLRLEACVFQGNEPSTRLLEKAGYTFEGRRRKAVVKNGVPLDLLMYSLLLDECVPPTAG